MAKKNEMDSTLEFIIGVVLFIPIAAYFLIKWVFQALFWILKHLGIAWEAAEEKCRKKAEKKKAQAAKAPLPEAVHALNRKTETVQAPEEAPDDWDEEDEFEDDEEDEDLTDVWEDSEDPNDGPVIFESVQPEKAAAGKDGMDMATIIGAGKYVFGEDLPLGKYDLKVVSGNGTLIIRYGETEDDETWINMGKDNDYAQEYRNLSLERGYYFSLDDNLRVTISRSKMLEIDP